MTPRPEPWILAAAAALSADGPINLVNAVRAAARAETSKPL